MSHEAGEKMKRYDLSGKWDIEGWGEAVFPGTMDTNGYGFEEASSKTRLRRVNTYVGKAVFTRKIDFTVEKGNRAILSIERAKKLDLYIDNQIVDPVYPLNITTISMWDVTDRLTGNNQIRIISDNSYEGWPAEDIIASSASTDETQTNYNGLLGKMMIEEKAYAYIDTAKITVLEDNIVVETIINSSKGTNVTLSCRVDSQYLILEQDVSLQKGVNCVTKSYNVADIVFQEWGEYDGRVYEGKIIISDKKGILDEINICFGNRKYGANAEGLITLNDKPIFLRSETCCGLFPDTGYEPMTKEEWIGTLCVYKEYGVNYVRFHSHTPPEAAFFAADELGIMLQPELSCWNHETAFEMDIAYSYYENELIRILRQYGKHPSFVALTLGNELSCSKLGYKRMGKLIELAKSIDSTKLYAIGSNCWYGEKGIDEYSDFYTASKYLNYELRGTFAAEEGTKVQGVSSINLGGCINTEYPNNTRDYGKAMACIRKNSNIPVFGFEVGQFEILPDFNQIADYKGVTRADNIACVKELSRQRKIPEKKWQTMVKATGELALLAYKKEVELAMLTPGFSGISLLGLQDFTGQGTALVGMMDGNLKKKPYDFANPKRFKEFFCKEHPILMLEKYTYLTSECLDADVVVVIDGQKQLIDHVHRDFSEIRENKRVDIIVSYKNNENTYSVWVYVPVESKLPKDVYETSIIDDKALEILQQGGKVFFTPCATKEALPHSILCHFTTDFWSKRTFLTQEGAMGQLINVEHPIFKDFPTEYHTNYQWWPMAVGRCVVIPDNIEPIIQELDSIDELRHMAQLFECRVENGYLLVSTMGLKEKQAYPECQALLNSIYNYLSDVTEYGGMAMIDKNQLFDMVL